MPMPLKALLSEQKKNWMLFFLSVIDGWYKPLLLVPKELSIESDKQKSVPKQIYEWNNLHNLLNPGRLSWTKSSRLKIALSVFQLPICLVRIVWLSHYILYMSINQHKVNILTVPIKPTKMVSKYKTFWGNWR